MINPFNKKILNTINKYQMIARGDKILVGLSGGPDSVALLDTLNKLKDLLDIKLYALHINHKLRAQAADADERFALRICQEMAIKIKSVKVNVQRFAQTNKMSIEEGARVIRYKYFEQEAKRLGCSKIAVGHNANDNTETVILNLVRGAGLAGLSGIPPVRDKIIRPLIETSRKDIINYLRQNKLKYCHDLTNIELGYRRNYIRHKIIPLLEKINPNLIETVLRTSQIIRDTNLCILKMCEQVKKDVLITATKNSIVLDIKKLLSYNVLIRRELLKQMVPQLDFEQIEKVLALARKPSGKSLALSQNWHVWKEYNRLGIAQKQDKTFKTTNKSCKSWKVNIGEKTSIPELGLEIVINEKRFKRLKVQRFNDCKKVVFDKSEISLPLSIRMRKTGDRFIPFKGKEMKLKDVLINDKIPVRVRDRLPLLCDKNNILWIIGSRRSNIGLINSNTKEILEAKVRKWQNNQFENQ